MESTITQINNRQSKLIPDFSNSIAIVAGLGGIGSWVALDLALIGVGSIFIFDKDKVETSNLNRTLFKESHIGKYKTKAVKELIAERRKDCIVLGFEQFFEAGMLSKFEGLEYFFDCTDTLRLKDSLYEYKTKQKMDKELKEKAEKNSNKKLKRINTVGQTTHYNTQNSNLTKNVNDIEATVIEFPQYVKLGYDGFEGTISLNDFDSGKWGSDSSYRFTPSFFGTPQLLSATAVIEMLVVKNKSVLTKTINVKTLLTK